MSDQHSKYKTMGRRFFAGLVDAVTYLALATVLQAILLLIQHPIAYLINVIVHPVLLYTYVIYMTQRFGGTLGKLYMNIRVVTNETEQQITVSQSIRRELLNILTLFPHLTLVIMVFANYSKDQFLSLLNPNIMNPWIIVDMIMTLILVTSEFLTALFNSRRRAIHDFIGNTVVICTGQYRPYSRLIAIILFIAFFTIMLLTGFTEKMDNMLKSVA